MRAFIAIEMPKKIRESIYQFGSGIPGKISRVAESNIHVTLQFLGNIADESAAKAIDEIKKVDAESFSAEADGISYFGGREIRTVFAKIIDHGKITSIYSSIGKGLADSGINQDTEKKYIPHATIARIKEENVELRAFIGQNSSHHFGKFSVNSICFMKSILTEKGPLYSTVYEHFLKKSTDID